MTGLNFKDCHDNIIQYTILFFNVFFFPKSPFDKQWLTQWFSELLWFEIICHWLWILYGQTERKKQTHNINFKICSVIQINVWIIHMKHVSILTRNYSFQSIHLQYYHYYYYYEESFGQNTLNSGKVLCSGKDSKALI